MADLSNSSFIPKRGPTKRRRGGPSRHVYLFTIVSYILMFATLLVTGGVFFYGAYTDRQLEEEISALKAETSSFSVADMQEVMEADSRLTQAFGRLENSVSMVSVFEALEASTINTVKISSLDLERAGDASLTLAAAIETDSFDSTIFQRGIYEDNDAVTSILISELQASGLANTEDDVDRQEESGQQKLVTFTADIEVPLSAVPYEGVEVGEFDDQPLTITQPANDIELDPIVDGEVDSLDNNEENI